ncbi:MAG: hypothetical protein ACTSPV_17925, partial [Candidatus Hodarchaeales archaeon]
APIKVFGGAVRLTQFGQLIIPSVLIVPPQKFFHPVKISLDLKDRVIIPPASDIKTSQDRLAKAKAGEFECLDWWLCHKPLSK